MPFPTDCYESDVLALMSRAFDAAQKKITARSHEADLRAVYKIMELRIMAAVREGERDTSRLTQLALDAIKGA
jgi:hypothetical protein